MNHSFKNENGHLTAKAIFAKDEIAKASQKAINHLCQNVTVKGFRKGKAPIDEASHYLRNEDIVNRTIDNLLKTVDDTFEKDPEFSEYLKKNQILGHFRPHVNVDKFSADEAEFTIVYVLRPTVTKLGSYKDLKSDAVEKTVTDKDVEAELTKLANDNAELVPETDKAAKMGDTANIDFVGLMDGKEFDGGSAKEFDLELGSKHFVPGFEEQIVSHKAGDKFDVKLTMPDNYPAPLTSKAVVFKVTVNAIKVKQVPTIDDDFATTLSGENAAKDLADLKAKITARLAKANKTGFRNEKVNGYLLQCRETSEFAIPSEYLDAMVQDRMDSDAKRIEQQGLSLEEYLKLINKNEEDYKNEIKIGLTSELQSSLIYDAIAEAEKLPMVNEEDVAKKINSPVNKFINNFTQYLKSQKLPEDQIRNEINNYLNNIVASIMSERVQNKILELNGDKIEEEKPVEKAEEKKPEDKALDASDKK